MKARAPKKPKFKMSKAQRKKLLIRALPLYAMLILPVIWYLVFCYLPMGGLVIAFEKYNVFVGFGSPWLTNNEGELDLFGHFRRFLSDEYFWRAFLNTVRLGFWNTLFCFPAPIILSLLFNEMRHSKIKKISQTASYLPYFVSTVACVSILTMMLSRNNGLINNIISALGGSRINFLVEPDYFVVIYVMLNLWRSVGWGTIIYTAAISAIDPALYDAAAIDGAGRFRQMIYITLPSIKPQIIIMLILAIPGIINADFEEVLLLQQDQNLVVSETVATYIYNRGIGSAYPQYDYTTAIGLFYSIITMGLVLGANKLADKTSKIGLF
ncbi:MAG: sugar ABC transporter permease [Bacilli bacterium]|nr:sugar ABC transporter permease [Bacilli bacterium]